MEVDSLLQQVERSIVCVENEIDYWKGKIDELKSTQDPERERYFWEKKLRLRKREGQLRQEKLLLLQKKLLQFNVRQEAVSGKASVDVVRLWKNLGQAVSGTCEVEVPAHSVTSSVSCREPAIESPAKITTRIGNSARVYLPTLTLPQETVFISSQMSTFVIREVYVKLARDAYSILRGERSDLRHMLVTGTPGTGKTVFGYYMLYLLRTAPVFPDHGAIIWEEGSGVSYYFNRDEVTQGRNGDFDPLIDRHTIFLVNGPEPVMRPTHNQGRCIVFTSTKDIYGSCMKQFIKDVRKQLYYMPLWDLCELWVAAEWNNDDVSAVEKRYARYGGSARSVLSQHDDPSYVAMFEKALSDARDKAEIKYMVGDDMSSFILHLKVTDADCMTTSVVFASRYVEKQLDVLTKLDTIRQATEYVSKYLFCKSEEGVTVGKRFEFLVQKLLSSDRAVGRKFKARRLITPAKTMLIAERDEQQFGGELVDGSEEEAEGGRFEEVTVGCSWAWAREGDQSLFVTLAGEADEAAAFQVTVNKYHGANAKYIQDLTAGFCLSKFYFVVPEDMFSTYPYQSLLMGKQEYIWPCELWVLGVPMNFFNDIKAE